MGNHLPDCYHGQKSEGDMLMLGERERTEKPRWRNGKLVHSATFGQEVLWYLAVPITPDRGQGETVWSNLGAGAGYLAELLVAGLCVVAPWMEYCSVLRPGDPDDEIRGMELDIQVLLRCQGVITCGPRISAGMEAELEVARRYNMFWLDFVGRAAPLDAAGIRGRLTAWMASGQERIVVP